MRIVSFIESHQTEVIEKILRHCGLWKERTARAPPPLSEMVECRSHVDEEEQGEGAAADLQEGRGRLKARVLRRFHSNPEPNHPS